MSNRISSRKQFQKGQMATLCPTEGAAACGLRPDFFFSISFSQTFCQNFEQNCILSQEEGHLEFVI